MDVSLVLQAVASVTTLIAMWMMGNKHASGPALCLGSDACFLALDVYLELWALIPFMAVLIAIHARNFVKWRLG